MNRREEQYAKRFGWRAQLARIYAVSVFLLVLINIWVYATWATVEHDYDYDRMEKYLAIVGLLATVIFSFIGIFICLIYVFLKESAPRLMILSTLIAILMSLFYVSLPIRMG